MMTKQEERGRKMGEGKEDLGKEHLITLLRVDEKSRATDSSLCVPER